MLPSTTALGIPELLEMVLDYAAPQDLLLWQRVNKSWQAAIERSPRFQEKLFFRIRETRKTVSDENCVVWNPFLKFFAHGSIDGWHLFFDDAFDGKASHPSASWRRMYFSSPAVTELYTMMKFDDKSRHPLGGLQVHELVSCATGVVLGKVADTLKKHVTHNTEHYQFAKFVVGLQNKEAPLWLPRP